MVWKNEGEAEGGKSMEGTEDVRGMIHGSLLLSLTCG